MIRTLALVCSLILFASTSLWSQLPAASTFWFKADQGLAVNGTSVTNWNSADGNSVQASQNAVAAQPTLISNDINGHPAVRLNGAQYMTCSSVYPVSQDYTLFIVVQLSNLAATNNIVSGNSHAVYYNPPHLLHGDFNTQAISSNSLTTAPGLVTVRFRQASQYATVSVNGSLEDSAFVGTNVDSSLFLGAFQAANFMVGDLAEALLYSRLLNATDVRKTEDYLLQRFGIARWVAPIIDTTFAEIPQQLQFFVRDQNNGADVHVRGAIHQTGFDSIRLDWYRDQLLIHTQRAALQYNASSAEFSFNERIQSELREYRLEVTIQHNGVDSLIAMRDKLVCGDVYLISGQSNTVMVGTSNQHEFVRTFGVNYSLNKQDTLWSLGTASQAGGGSTIGAWGLRLAELIVMNHQIPVCIINGGVGGTTIEQNSRVDAQPDALNSIYGSMLYRVKKSKFTDKAKAMFWYQGESNDITNYAQNFHKLYSDWMKDYPSLQKVYMVQIRPGCANFAGHDRLRDLQRALQDTLANLEVMSAVGLPGHDGCHYAAIGYTTLGDNMFRIINKDFYNSTDSIAISAPNIKRIFFTNSDHKELALFFKPALSAVKAQADTTINGVVQSIKDYFYLNDSIAVKSISTRGDTLFLGLKFSSQATALSYTPAVYYNGTTTIYEGPWLVNQRGIGALTFANVPISPKTISDVNDASKLTIRHGLDINPNPAMNEITVAKPTLQKQVRDVILIDDNGRQLALSKWKDNGSMISIDTESIASGHYALKLVSEESVEFGEFVIVK